ANWIDCSNVTWPFGILLPTNNQISARSAISAKTIVKSSNTSLRKSSTSAEKQDLLISVKSPWTAVASKATLPSIKIGPVSRLPRRSKTSSTKPPKSTRRKTRNMDQKTEETSSRRNSGSKRTVSNAYEKPKSDLTLKNSSSKKSKPRRFVSESKKKQKWD